MPDEARTPYPAYKILKIQYIASFCKPDKMRQHRIRQSTAGGHKMAADFYLFTTIKCACIMSLAGRPCASKSAIALRYGGRWRK
ncbi:hypothetical protein BEM40_015225 [Escherichia sp. MOD1-EC5451]|nr:hypothetical protein [Escherichia coli]PSS39737.1 hypothetical protein BEM40_015225 [Escherichia sp. MOD1-EC5451]